MIDKRKFLLGVYWLINEVVIDRILLFCNESLDLRKDHQWLLALQENKQPDIRFLLMKAYNTAYEVALSKPCA